MKSCEEMTNAVLMRVREEKATQKRRRRKVLAAAGCVCFALLAVFAGAKTAQPSGGEESRKPRVSVFCVTANAAEQPQQMLKGGKVPYNAVLLVRDITGLSDQKVQELQNADKEHADRMAEKNPEKYGKFNWSVTSYKTDKTLATTIFAGSFYLTVDNYEQVRDVSVTTTEIGSASMNGTDYYDASLVDGVGITWSLSGEGMDMIEKSPEMTLSQITDTVIVTVEFIDGTKEIVFIDITVDDAGQIYGTFQGTNFAQ